MHRCVKRREPDRGAQVTERFLGFAFLQQNHAEKKLSGWIVWLNPHRVGAKSQSFILLANGIQSLAETGAGDVIIPCHRERVAEKRDAAAPVFYLN